MLFMTLAVEFLFRLYIVVPGTEIVTVVAASFDPVTFFRCSAVPITLVDVVEVSMRFWETLSILEIVENVDKLPVCEVSNTPPFS